MTPTSSTPVTPTTSRAWWREPMMWLVVGGPLAVIVAGIATITMAVRHPDPLVAEDYYRRGVEINKTLAEQAAARQALVPAQQARNHTATPEPQPAGSR